MYLKQRFWEFMHALQRFFSVAARKARDWEWHAARQHLLRLNVPQLKPPTRKELCAAANQIVGTPYWRTIKIELLTQVEMFRSQIGLEMNPEAPGFREKFIAAQIGIRAREDFILMIEQWADETVDLQEDEENGKD